jgi:hypothetical protein
MSSEEKNKSLVAQKGFVKGSITKLKNSITEEFLENANLEKINVRIERMEHLFQKFEAVNMLVMDDDDESNVEEMYFETMASLKTKLAQIKSEGKEAQVLESSQSTESASISRLKLPQVNIPAFTGKYSDFNTFKEFFIAVIDKDDRLEDIQKFLYLRSYLRDEALNLVVHLPIVSSSYKGALDILDERYNNEFKIINEHIKAIINIPAIKKTNVFDIRKMLGELKQHLEALKNLKQPVEHWDTLLLSHILDKLDAGSVRAFHMERD